MPKRARNRSRSKSQISSKSLDEVSIDDIGHTPKWTRSSASASPPPTRDAAVQDAADPINVIDPQNMQCILPGHSLLTFASTSAFEIHYAKDHNNQCVECKANLPSPWILELHQNENHNPLIAARRESDEKIYQCFLQDCEKVTLTPQKRRLHLIDAHGFPKNYDFRIVDLGSRGKRSLLREQNPPNSHQRRRISDVGKPGWRDRNTTTSDQHKTLTTQSKFDEGTEHDFVGSSIGENSSATQTSFQKSPEPRPTSEDDPIDSLSKTLSSLTFVPLSVRMRNKKKS